MKLIIFEGLDGSGKTSLIKSVQQELQKQGNEVVVIRGLGSSTIGNSIRETFLTHNNLHNLTRYFLSFANMIQTQEECIKHQLKTNKIILVDRWLGSNFAYRVYPSKIDKNYHIFNNLSKKFIKPDITIYLKIHPQLGLERKINQKNHQLDVIETSSLTYFQQVEKGYFEFLKKQNIGTKIILNNMNDKDAKFNQQYIIKKIGEIKNGNNN
ncbi:thymidylate kinase [Aster yellows witches'-broom phytoplasma AYWB]|uniref:Thymidylate kinase n=2 Tax=16SrI (Aster yellows group) TaxID=3042590 RepID=Q2NJU5_AYWBP|nr:MULTISPECIES: dTMP kinase [16SrI (Aster yellows group)]ABC65298.1 thymidylate kinase [Aster yellows witches'-broom phytoplasma AYWB]PEH36355.1 dTMP kinase [New Jersey aster yellows phytoplasma]